MHHLGRLVCRTRERDGLSRQQLAVRVGYTNTNKGTRRIDAIENGRCNDAGIIAKVIEALSISEAALTEAVHLDESDHRERYLDTIATPVAPSLVVRLMPGFCVPHPLPDGMRDHSELESVAREIARTMGKSVHLVLPSRTSLWINPSGEVYERSEPDEYGDPVVPGTKLGNKALPDLFASQPDHDKPDA